MSLILLFATFFLAFMFCFYFMPILMRMANKFSLYDHPNHIKKHKKSVTFLGGVSIVLSFYFSLMVLRPAFASITGYGSEFFIGLFVIFIYGLGDDLLNFKPLKKLVLQLAISAVFIHRCNFHLNFEGILPWFAILKPWYFVIEVVIFTSILNSFNLLDGFDGLAGAVSMVNVLILTYIFYVSKQDLFCQITVCLAGSLFAFLFYNKPTARVFMGDSGSLFLGMFFAFFSFYLNDNINNNHVAQNANINAVISYSFIALPVMDMFRLIIWRVKNRKHPFVGDNSHIHHLLSQMGLKPVMVLGVLVLLHITLIILSYLLKNVFIFTFIASTFIVYLILIKYIRYEIARRQLPKKDSHIGIKNQFINTGFLNDRALGSKLQDITPSEFPLNK